MGIKLIWTGVIFMLAINLVLSLIGLNGSDVLPKVGAVVAVIGLVLLWLDK